MERTTSLLSLDATEGARALMIQLAHELLDAATVVRDQPKDSTAWRKLRMRLFRLHANARYYRPYLTRGFVREDRRLLRRLNIRVRRLRALELALVELRSARASLTERGRERSVVKEAKLAAKLQRRHAGVLAMIDKMLSAGLVHSLERLSRYHTERVVGMHAQPIRFAQLVRDQLSKRVAALADATSLSQAIKNGCAVVAPVAGNVPELCALHEAFTAAQKATSPNGESAAALSPQLAALMNQVPVALDVLRSFARQGVEIERKYLLREAPETALAVPGIRIAQGWLPGKRLRERLRRSVFPDGRVTWVRTVKFGAGMERLELEEATDPMLFESLWPLTSGARVEKIRHVVIENGITWEIDVFLDRALVLAEVELDAGDTEPVLPTWLSAVVVREVTGESEYVNSNLATSAAQTATPGVDA